MTETDSVVEATQPDIEQWLSTATPEEVRVPICMNRALLAEFDACITEFEVRRPQASGIAMLDSPELDAELERLRNRIIELKTEIEEDERKHTYIIRKGDYNEWRQIVESHPPTEQQKERFQGYIDFDHTAAGPAMVAFSCITPKMDIEQAERLRAALPEHVWDKLRDAAIQVNRTGNDLPLSVRRTVDQLATAVKSTTPAKEASPSARSGAGSSKKGKQSGRRTTGK